jgi:hypothetical protein
MNIFILNSDPIKAAQDHCDKHCVKMVTELSQQLACAAIRHKVPTHLLPLTKKGTPVRGGYHKHPCSIWCGDSRTNYDWACRHGLALAREYTKRFNKVHFCEKGIRQLYNLIDYIPEGDLTNFAIAINEESECRKQPNFSVDNPVEAYRLYYIHDKAKIAKWKYTKQPDWFKL